MSKEKDKKIPNEIKKSNKAMFIQRLVAYLIDSAIVVFAASLLSIPFINNDRINELNNKSYELMEKYKDKKISNNEYIVEYMNLSYDIAKNEGIVTLIGVIMSLIVFVIIPFYKNGQTIGKKLLKIKVTSMNGDLTMNQLIFRSFIANSILIDIISVVLIITTSKNNYFYCYSLFVILQYIITVISVFMIIINKEGRTIHDLLTNTKVVRI